MDSTIEQFIIANNESPVVSGAPGAGGSVTYTLDDERVFTLTHEECVSLRNGKMPVWKEQAA